MLKLKLAKNTRDSEMVDIIEVPSRERGRVPSVWGSLHIDFLYDPDCDSTLYDKVKSEDEVIVGLVFMMKG